MTDLRALVEQYKAQFSKASERLKEQYKNAPQKIETLKQKATELQPMVRSWIETNQNNAKMLFMDFSPVGVEMAVHKTMLEIYTLISVGLLAAMVGHVVGRSFVGFLVQMFFSTNYAVALGLVVLPAATVYILQKTDELRKEDRAMLVLASSFATAVLLGWVMSEYYLPMTPPMFILPLGIGLGSVFMGPSMGRQSRANFLGVCLGGSVGFYFAFGLITGNLSGPYVMWTIALAGVAFLDYQTKLARLYEGSASLAADATISIAVYSAAGFLLTAMFGSSSPPV